MGWTYTDLVRNRMTLEQAKKQHTTNATRYIGGIKASLLAEEWHPQTWYAIIKLEYPEGDEKHGKPETFLRVDLLEASSVSFGYKDMCEEMGPYVSNPPSQSFKSKIFKHIPDASRYAAEFRQCHGIRYSGDGRDLKPAAKQAAPNGTLFNM